MCRRLASSRWRVAAADDGPFLTAMSGERLRARPEDLMLWDWDTTWVQFDNEEHPEQAAWKQELQPAVS